MPKDCTTLTPSTKRFLLDVWFLSLYMQQVLTSLAGKTHFLPAYFIVEDDYEAHNSSRKLIFNTSSALYIPSWYFLNKYAVLKGKRIWNPRFFNFLVLWYDFGRPETIAEETHFSMLSDCLNLIRLMRSC